MKPIVLCSVALLCATAHADQNWGKAKSISLERTPCFGACPIYRVTINSDGTILYHGERFVDRIGDYRARVSSSAFRKLARAVDRLGYWGFSRSYDSNVTDLPSQIVTVKTNRFVKTVSEYGSTGPDKLEQLHKLIDNVLKSARRWQKLPQQVRRG